MFALATPLWRTGLLLACLRFCACLEEDCVLGVVGQPVSLPCFYPGLSTSGNFSFEWRRDGEVVLRSEWEGDRNVEQRSFHSATVSAAAVLSGNLSLKLDTVTPKDDKVYYSLFIISEENQSAELCTKCLRTAASFSSPLLQREAAADWGETTFFCHSSGGFPEPAVYWLIDDTEEPPEGSVSTLTTSHPDTHLYNITSHLSVNVSKDSSVSCIVENQFMNETLTSTSYGVRDIMVKSRASDAMWMFGTAMCVVVGVMVMVGVVYQIHLDKSTKRKKKEYQNRGYKRREPYKTETDVLETEPKETDV